MYLSLFGAIVCVVIMFTMSWITALITFIVFLLIFGFLKYRKPDVNWGSSMHANHYKRTLKLMHKMHKEDDHVKNYRPQILVLSSSRRRDLTVFAHSITRGSALLMHATIQHDDPSSKVYSSTRETI
ncbi:hypothetical protein PENTCL1PPCAC_10816 [Pristionchus entomophagus]|uniref:Amino acid permease/ SLC12A domain-containing protein n=1 Tax=Pristionchus entomophagus TaxID=358040 RepID=A0AAV5TAH5_9BILA|nr:hypothetical protein PENTCL1PPCAC_10816 [Pristionchus entomophagus]